MERDSLVFFLLRNRKFQHRFHKSRDRVGSMAARCGLDDPGIESRSRRDFPQLLRLAHSASCIVGTESRSPGLKRSGRGGDHPPPSSAKVKERVEIYLHSPFLPSWPILSSTLLLPTRPVWPETSNCFPK